MELRIAVGADHAGWLLKKEIIALLEEMKLNYRDFGTYSGEPVDYPDIAVEVARQVAGGGFDLGILCCGTGIGMSIAANKVPGIRAALCHDTCSAHCAREHNDANVLALGGRVLGPSLAREIAASWLAASFSGGRHAARVAKINELDQIKQK